MVDLISLISAFGLGAIGSKLLDIFWLQEKVSKQLHAQWLKDRRLEAFSSATKELLSFGLHRDRLRNPFESYGEIARALLLIDDETLSNRLDTFITDADKLITLSKKNEDNEAEVLYERLIIIKESRFIMKCFRALVLEKGVRS